MEIEIYSVVKINIMIKYGILLIVTFIWIAFEMYRAPMMDENGKIIKPGKKLSDLWKK